MYNFESDSSLIIYVSRRNRQTAGVLFRMGRGPSERPWSPTRHPARLAARTSFARGSRPRFTCVSI